GENVTPFVFTVARTVACGSAIQFTLNLRTQGTTSNIPFTINVGNFQALGIFSDDIESGDAKWKHARPFKKKKKKQPIDPWTISTRRGHSGGNSWFGADSDSVTDAHLDSQPIALPADVRNLQLIFYHTFDFESGGYDGGVLEIS